MRQQNSQESKLLELPYFLYDVDIYIISKKSASLLSSRTYKSDKLLNVPEVKVIKRLKNFNIERFITLIGAPKDYI